MVLHTAYIPVRWCSEIYTGKQQIPCTVHWSSMINHYHPRMNGGKFRNGILYSIIVYMFRASRELYISACLVFCLAVPWCKGICDGRQQGLPAPLLQPSLISTSYHLCVIGEKKRSKIGMVEEVPWRWEVVVVVIMMGGGNKQHRM